MTSVLSDGEEKSRAPSVAGSQSDECTECTSDECTECTSDECTECTSDECTECTSVLSVLSVRVY